MQNQHVHTPLQNTQPLISFIITCYDLSIEMLRECIDSIRALSLLPAEREIILIDDGSENSPINSLMAYGGELLYVRQNHAGVSVARNHGMRMAKGKYIQFVDGDDYLIYDAYERCLDIIRQQEDADIVLFDFTRKAPLSSPEGDTIEAPSGAVGGTPTTGVEFMHNHNLHGAVWCCLFRQAIRGTLEFTPGICYGEDEEFTAQLLLRAESVWHTTTQAYYYRSHSGSAVHQTDKESTQKRLDDTHAVILHLHYIADRLPQNDRLALQRRVAQLTMDYIYNTIMLTRSSATLESLIADLRKEGLFPLPDRDYSTKYTWFRRLTNTTVGRRLLLHTLPLLMVKK